MLWGTRLEGDERVRGGHGDVRRRPFDGGGGPRGRGLVRHRQPAGRPDHEDGRDGGPPRVRHRPGGARHRARGRQHGPEYFDDLPDVLDELRANRNRVRVVFLDAADDVLVRRYEGTRRRHPLAARGVEESIADERKLLEPVRERADLLIDTGELNSNQLRLRILEAFGDDEAPHMQTSVVSFGYKHGIPLDVDVVFDCRFLPNPFWIEELRPFSGKDEPGARVRPGPARVPGLPGEGGRAARPSIIPAFAREGKSYLTIAMGCTGGRHRSVTLAQELGERLSGHGEPVSVFHRDIDR